jgi:hypothetical protein
MLWGLVARLARLVPLVQTVGLAGQGRIQRFQVE